MGRAWLCAKMTKTCLLLSWELSDPSVDFPHLMRPCRLAPSYCLTPRKGWTTGRLGVVHIFPSRLLWQHRLMMLTWQSNRICEVKESRGWQPLCTHFRGSWSHLSWLCPESWLCLKGALWTSSTWEKPAPALTSDCMKHTEVHIAG